MGGGMMRQPGRGGFAGQFNGAATSALRSAESIKTSIGLDVLLYGVGIAFLIAILGSAFPAYFISKIRPAEVMRAD
jgi:ABC-type antimicrobial peptide transport system permease subunit